MREAITLCGESLAVVQLCAARLEVKRARLEAACTAELFATDSAYELAAGGMPFRDAYRAVAAAPDAAQPGDLITRLRARTSEGAPANLALDAVAARIAGDRASCARRQPPFPPP